MNFDWGGYVEVGRALRTVAPTLGDANLEEAALRAAISRSYYGAFNMSYDRYRAMRDAMPPHAQKAEPVHRWLYDRYLAYAASSKTASDARKRAYRKIADNLKLLKKYRVQADYEVPNLRDPDRLARASIRMADEIIQELAANP